MTGHPPSSTLFPSTTLSRSEMLEDFLAVRGPVLHPPHQFHQLGMHAANPGVVHRLLPRLDDAGIDVRLCLFHDLFDAAWMDAAVGDEPLERQASDLAAHQDRKSTRLNSSHSQI